MAPTILQSNRLVCASLDDCPVVGLREHLFFYCRRSFLGSSAMRALCLGGHFFDFCTLSPQVSKGGKDRRGGGPVNPDESLAHFRLGRCFDNLLVAVLMAHKKVNLQVKDCAHCGRPFRNRKKWILRGIWDQILYCSEKCRRSQK